MLLAKFNTKKTKLNISMTVEPPRPSASGKSELIATSGGKVRTDALLDDGRRVHVICNAFVYPEDSKPKIRHKGKGSGDGRRDRVPSKSSESTTAR